MGDGCEGIGAGAGATGGGNAASVVRTSRSVLPSRLATGPAGTSSTSGSPLRATTNPAAAAPAMTTHVSVRRVVVLVKLTSVRADARSITFPTIANQISLNVPQARQSGMASIAPRLGNGVELANEALTARRSGPSGCQAIMLWPSNCSSRSRS